MSDPTNFIAKFIKQKTTVRKREFGKHLQTSFNLLHDKDI
ncbi:hypothetical protein F442_05330 [Phytophthora nicotianae P10297]|uniref:Uncharacterized protein n=5 Tax=Phytophthora nicotianae TaxID=4792 RepID=W2QHP8_PHYN3|nr:hypothetical protein PPTG_22537 [Phytophthora nicotianae INRA-310]ETI51346.1 hypothetical protein F443_05283 [Phytophthora nicotianae P1569]ETL97776.1 hypothetical protein L917_04984 [Phytophthora nicotianae]ETO80043.1 hypothetical protein F444_05327 [Phytophthora nicotianae P1976]ETP49031.1 hypothetical protein F442_05330 [Phytophthora nicotianae P10297]ETN11770.1 hypothetical protein PPTG_22537 [Phytophthora nicotianae INRA-310]